MEELLKENPSKDPTLYQTVFNPRWNVKYSRKRKKSNCEKYGKERLQ
jgi:hypothetical protein